MWWLQLTVCNELGWKNKYEKSKGHLRLCNRYSGYTRGHRPAAAPVAHGQLLGKQMDDTSTDWLRGSGRSFSPFGWGQDSDHLIF